MGDGIVRRATARVLTSLRAADGAADPIKPVTTSRVRKTLRKPPAQRSDLELNFIASYLSSVPFFRETLKLPQNKLLRPC